MTVLQLPKKLSYTFFAFMFFIIFLHFLVLTEVKHIGCQDIEMITKKAFNLYFHQKNKSDFIQLYQKAHKSEPICKKFFEDLKYEIYQNPDKVEDLCSWVKEAEEGLHIDAKAAYNCILENFGGSDHVTARIVDPQGGIAVKIASTIDKLISPRKIRCV